LRHSKIPFSLWHEAITNVPVLQRLPRKDRQRLRKMSSLFLQRKVIIGANGFDADQRVKVIIAAQACLLILYLNLDYYDGWVEIIVYPEPFIVKRGEIDDSGVVHQERRALSGESWGKGPVVLAWSDIELGGRRRGPGHNVVLHEFAHKLDTLNGPADGLPPLHSAISVERWSRDFSKVYENLQYQIKHHRHTALDSYAGYSPAEFFAVVSETFFEAPELINHHYPRLYQDLCGFYRQDPLAWPGGDELP